MSTPAGGYTTLTLVSPQAPKDQNSRVPTIKYFIFSLLLFVLQLTLRFLKYKNIGVRNEENQLPHVDQNKSFYPHL